MNDIRIRTSGRAGRITLTRPQALNAVTYEMCMAIEQALDAWRDDDEIALVVIDAEGDRAFSAGGDIQEMYRTGTAGDYAYGRKFWRDEYRMNAKIATYPKPYVALMQGFTMGGGVGVSCHGSHRIVGESSQIAMPECGIGLVPDVGGTYLLAKAPGRLGEYLGATGTRMGPGDALYAGFADYYIPQSDWPELIAALEESGDAEACVRQAAAPDAVPEAATLEPLQREIDACFAGDTLRDIVNVLRATDSDFATTTLKTMSRNSPLAMACAVELVHRVRGPSASVAKALELEYRFTHRAMEHADFLEGIRAQVVDKDRNPKWRHDLETGVGIAATQMLMPLGADSWRFEQGAKA